MTKSGIDLANRIAGQLGGSRQEKNSPDRKELLGKSVRERYVMVRQLEAEKRTIALLDLNLPTLEKDVC